MTESSFYWRDYYDCDGVSEDPEPLTDDEQQFLDRLIALGCTVWVGKRPWWEAKPGETQPEFVRPQGWQHLHPRGNEERLGGFAKGRSSLCLNTGGAVAVVDVDPRNVGDIEKMRALLDELGVQVFAEVRTPAGGVHFYIAGHWLLPSVHSTEENQRLPGYAGVDVQSYGANVFGPGTLRPKYDDAGYEIVVDHLEQLCGDGGTGALAEWVADQLAVGVKAKARKTPGGAGEWEWDPCEPWDGTPPDARAQAYLDAALRGEAQKVAAERDERNTALFTAALKLGSYVAGAGLDEQTVREALEKASEENGYTAEHGVYSTRASIASGLRCGGKNPRAVPEDTGSRSFFAKGVGLLALDLAEAVMESVTCGFNDRTEKFYVYSGGVWHQDQKPIERYIADLLGNRHRISHAKEVLNLIRFSPKVPRITCEPLPDYVNVTNGMLDWASGQLTPHDPGYRSTVQLPVDYDPEAACPRFDQFLAEVLPKDCIDFFWEVIGYTMFSGNPLHTAVMLYGKGRNGKGTLIRVLKVLLGEQNITAVGLHDLTENRFRSAKLYGKLANLAGDLDSRWVSNTAAFKAITGGDQIQGENKFGTPFDFTPWALPFYSANEAFGSADSSQGWWSRWVVVPFPNSFTGLEDRKLDSKLASAEELRGILRKGLKALPTLMERGRFLEPPSVGTAKEEFIAASDAVRCWANEQCALDPDGWEPRKALHIAYQLHTFATGSKASMPAHKFYSRIENIAGVTAATRNGVRGFKGIRLDPEGADVNPDTCTQSGAGRPR